MGGVKKHIDPWETNAGGGGSRRYLIHWLPGALCEVMFLEGSKGSLWGNGIRPSVHLLLTLQAIQTVGRSWETTLDKSRGFHYFD